MEDCWTYFECRCNEQGEIVIENTREARVNVSQVKEDYLIDMNDWVLL